VSGVEYVPVIATGARGFAALLERSNLDAPVPSCPGWTVFDLAEHIGGIHQWAAHAIVHRSPDGQPTAAPKNRAGLVAWYRDSAGLMLNVLQETPEDAEVWHFGPRPRMVRFWQRRQAHEVTMHLHDLNLALGQAEPIDAVLAADGVDEVRNLFFPRQVRLERMPALARSLAVVVAETGGRYVFSGDGTGDDDERAEATVTAPAEILLLALWHRIPADDERLLIEGDPAAAGAVLAASLTA
jgi:uncharacterized protein (TIGR03083 family)